MKYFYLLGCLLLIGLPLIACGQDDTPTPKVEATVTAPPTDTPVPPPEATATAQPTDTPTPTTKATATLQPTDTPEPVQSSSYTSERPYRSYPAPTGFPGFRLYYQKRCYPGCHTYGEDSDQVHP